MCLYTLKTAEFKGKHVGYKIIRKQGKMLRPELAPSDKAVKHVLGEWTNDINDYGLYSDGAGLRYPTGFHVITTLAQARRWYAESVRLNKLYGYSKCITIYKVAFGKVLAYGTQDGLTVVVSDRVKLLEEVK